MNKSPKYLIIHDYNKVGSACMKFSPEQNDEFWDLCDECRRLAKPGLQIVSLTGKDALNAYSEYKPYVFYEDKNDIIDICISGNAPGVSYKEVITSVPGMRYIKAEDGSVQLVSAHIKNDMPIK